VSANAHISHPRDPYHLVEARHSDRHVRITIDGETVAETRRPLVVFETGLPPRYYIAPQDVQTRLLTQTEKHTRCPYKGLASYYSFKLNGSTHENAAWVYPNPEPEHQRLTDRVAFDPTKAEIYVNGEHQPE
jgi:uncharacterized protein (DUF427 family)